MSIIKRKKQDKFFIMSNHAPQQNLTSLSSIGLLAYIVSLPHDFKLHKTYLQNKFTRRTVDSAWNELVNKKYIAGFSCYINRKKQYFYLASDEQLTQEEFTDFVKESYAEIINDHESEPKNLQPIKDNQFIITGVQNVHHLKSTNVQSVQYKEYSTSSTVPNEQVQINTNKEIQQINNNKEKEIVNIMDNLYIELSNGLYSKQEWVYFTNKIIEENVNKEIYDLNSYIRNIVELMIYRRKLKLGIAKTPISSF